MIFFRTGSSYPLAPPNVVYYNCVRFHQYCFICLGENCAYDKYGLTDTDIWTDGHRHMDWRTQTYGLTDTDRVIPLYTVCKGYNYHWKSSHNPCLPFIIIDCLCLYVTSQISLLLKTQPFTPIMMILENLIHVPVCK